MTSRLAEATEQLDALGRPVKPHRSGGGEVLGVFSQFEHPTEAMLDAAREAIFVDVPRKEGMKIVRKGLAAMLAKMPKGLGDSAANAQSNEQVGSPLGVGNAPDFEALYELCRLKIIKEAMEGNIATPEMIVDYRDNKEKAWARAFALVEAEDPKAVPSQLPSEPQLECPYCGKDLPAEKTRW